MGEVLGDVVGKNRRRRQSRAIGPSSARTEQQPSTSESLRTSQLLTTSVSNASTLSIPVSAQHPRRKFVIWAISAVGVLSAAVTVIAWVIDDIPTYSKWMALLFICAVAAIFAPGWRISGRWRLIVHTVSLAVLTAIWLGLHISAQPSEAQRQISALMDDTEKANIWVGRDPVMFHKSSSYIEKHFSAFDPNTSHAWEELPSDKVAALTDLVVQSSGYSGHGVVTLGRVSVAQPLGGDQWVVQVTPISQATAESAKTRERVEAEVGVDYASTLLMDSIVDTNRVSYMLYVRIVLPPLGALPTDETVLVKGTPIAYGRTQDRNGRQMDVAYLVGSNIRRFYDSPLMTRSFPTPAPEHQSSK